MTTPETSHPFPRREELPMVERGVALRSEQRSNVALSAISKLQERAISLYNPAELYDDPTYLSAYIGEVDSTDVTDTYGKTFHAQMEYAAKDAWQDYEQELEYREAFLAHLPQFTRSLFAPVRDFTRAREAKESYRDIPIEGSDEPLVSLRDYNVANRNYFSRPSAASIPVPGLKPDIFVRQSVAEKLSSLNQVLSQPEITRFFGGEIEVCVDDGYRDPRIQQKGYHEMIPTIVARDLAEKEGIELTPEDFMRIIELVRAEETGETVKGIAIKDIRDERNRKSAKAPDEYGVGTPGPHQTGSAVDLAFRYKQDTLDFVPGVNVWFGKAPGRILNTNPDRFEHETPESLEQYVAQQNLRALHTLLESAGLYQNPTEFWHAGTGDQLTVVSKTSSTDGVAEFGWPAVEPQSFEEPQETKER